MKFKHIQAGLAQLELRKTRSQTRSQIYRDMRLLGIRPIERGEYPDNTVQLLESYLRGIGYVELPTMKQLRDIRRRAAQGRRAA